MVGDSLNLVEIVSLVPKTSVFGELADILSMTVGPPLQDLRVFMLELLILKPLLMFRSHDGLELVAHQLQRTVEVLRQVNQGLHTVFLNLLDNTKGILLHDFKFRS